MRACRLPNLLEGVRDQSQERRPDSRQRRNHVGNPRYQPCVSATDQGCEHDGLAEHMRQGKSQCRDRLLLRITAEHGAGSQNSVRRCGVHVAMADHAAFGSPRGPAGVDDHREVPAADCGHPSGWIVAPPALRPLSDGVERPHDVGACVHQPARVRVALGCEACGTRVRDDVLDLLRRGSGIHRNHDGANRQHRQIEHDPLETRSPEDGYPFPCGHSTIQERRRERPHALSKVIAGQRAQCVCSA